MKFAYFTDTDTLVIDLLEGPAAEGFDVAPSVVAHATADGRVTCVDIDHASERTSLQFLASGDPDIEWHVETLNSGAQTKRVPHRSNGRSRVTRGQIRCTYVQYADMLEVRFSEAQHVDEISVSPSIGLELNESGRISGVTIGFASAKITNFDPNGETPCVEWMTYVESDQLVPAA